MQGMEGEGDVGGERGTGLKFCGGGGKWGGRMAIDALSVTDSLQFKDCGL